MDISSNNKIKNNSNHDIEEILDESTGQIILKQATKNEHNLSEQLTDEDDSFNDLNSIDLTNDCETCMVLIVSYKQKKIKKKDKIFFSFKL